MRELVAKYLLLLTLTLTAPASFAHGAAPDALLRAAAAEVIAQLKYDPEFEAADAAKIAALVDTRIMPLFDFVQMTRLAMARNWRLATPEQQNALTQEFKTLLLRTYSSALAQYRDEIIHFRQLRSTSRDTEVTVRSEVKQPGKEPMTLDYDMEKTPEGWKIYDIKLAGVRLVTTYREVFAERIRNGGVDSLIKSLGDDNQGRGSKFNSIKKAFWEKSRVIYAIFQNAFRSGPQ